MSIIGNLPSADRRPEFEMDSEWWRHFSCRLIENFQSVRSICAAILPRHESQYTEIWGQISVWTPRNSDPGAYLRPSSTLEVICFHGTPPIYQQGRAIKVAITHIGALPPEMHRFDARCASRCRHGQSLMRCELDRGGWIGKPGETKRAMSAQVLLCRFALSQTPASRCNPSRRLVILRVHRSAVSIFSIIRRQG